MRIALIGLGNAASILHLPALAGLPIAEVVGGCDPDPARRARVANRWRIPVFEDSDRLLSQGADVVIVGTPPSSHADYCLRALEAGAHVICEKPFVSSLREADEVIAAADRAGRQVALNHEFREMPIFRAVLDEVDRGEAGDLRFVQLWQLMDLPPWREPGWRGLLLNRTLYEAGVHLVDILLRLFGAKPVGVTATTSSCGADERDTDAVALATFEFDGGRLAQLTQNRLCRGETHYFEVRADCARASLRASFGGRARLSAGLYRTTRPHVRFEFGVAGLAWKEKGSRRTVLARNPKDPAAVATRRVFEKSLEAFRSGGPPPTTAREARVGLEAIVGAYRSAQTGRRVELTDEALRGLATLRMDATATP